MYVFVPTNVCVRVSVCVGDCRVYLCMHIHLLSVCVCVRAYTYTHMCIHVCGVSLCMHIDVCGVYKCVLLCCISCVSGVFVYPRRVPVASPR